MSRFSVLALVAAIGLAACGGGGSSNQSSAQNAASPQAEATNPIDFPLYQGSTVLKTSTFTQNVDTSQIRAGGAAFPQGSGTYAGTQVIAKTDASLEQLAGWLHDTSTTPPNGYAVATKNAGLQQARQRAQRYGIDFVPFTKTENGKMHGIVVLAMDPAQLKQRVGPAIGLIEKFRSLPDALRAPIDAQIKAKVGMSGSELLDPGSPIGAALAAYDDVSGSNARAIVLVDASKQ